MIGSFRNFAKTKFAGILVFIMIIPFVFWGMGSMFSSGNTNSIVKINETNISTEEFIDYLNNSGIPQDTIRENLNDNIIEELLSTLISTTLINLEINDLDIIISENTLLNQIKKNKNSALINYSNELENNNFKKIIYFIFSILLAICVYLTQSRNGIIGTFTSTLLLSNKLYLTIIISIIL